MFARIITRIQTRRALRSLLARADDHLMQDIGLDRADVERMLADDLPAAPTAIGTLFLRPVMPRRLGLAG